MPPLTLVQVLLSATLTGTKVRKTVVSDAKSVVSASETAVAILAQAVLSEAEFF